VTLLDGVEDGCNDTTAGVTVADNATVAGCVVADEGKSVK
jgi:hypothetical protein